MVFAKEEIMKTTEKMKKMVEYVEKMEELGFDIQVLNLETIRVTYFDDSVTLKTRCPWGDTFQMYEIETGLVISPCPPNEFFWLIDQYK